MTSKAAKRRARRNRALITLPGADPVASRPTGKDRRHTNQHEDARRTVLEARCRRTGRQIAPDAMSALSEQMAGCDTGLCIMHQHQSPEIRAELWQVWQDMSKAWRNWRLRYTGQTGTAQSAAIALIHEELQTDPGLTVDLRSADERDRDAKNARAYWDSQIAAVIAPNWQMALRSAIDGFGAPLWKGAEPTANGRCVVKALESIRESQKRLTR